MTSKKKNDPVWIQRLARLYACKPALRWCRKQSSLYAAWRHCSRGDWLDWLLYELSWPRGAMKLDSIGEACDFTVSSVRWAPQLRKAFPWKKVKKLWDRYWEDDCG